MTEIRLHEGRDRRFVLEQQAMEDGSQGAMSRRTFVGAVVEPAVSQDDVVSNVPYPSSFSFLEAMSSVQGSMVSRASGMASGLHSMEPIALSTAEETFIHWRIQEARNVVPWM